MLRRNSKGFKSTGSLVNVPDSFLESLAQSQDEILKLLQSQQPNDKALGDYVSEAEAIKAFGRRTTWFWNMRRAGKLPYTKVGNKVFYSTVDLQRLLEENKKGNEHE